MTEYDLHLKAAAIICDAGGELVGRTRLQKVVYLSQLAGFSDDFQFEYRHYGPYSEELAEAIEIAAGLRVVEEEERQAQWGGWYSVFSTDQNLPTIDNRAEFVAKAAEINAIELELAATAAFLYVEEGIGPDERDPWEETRAHKPEKAANGNLERAKEAYKALTKITAPSTLPNI